MFVRGCGFHLWSRCLEGRGTVYCITHITICVKVFTFLFSASMSHNYSIEKRVSGARTGMMDSNT